MVNSGCCSLHIHSSVPKTRASKWTFCIPGFHPWVRKILWRRKWQPTPVLLPGKSHGRRSPVGYSPWGRKELDRTEQLHFHFQPLIAQLVKNPPAMRDPGLIPGSGRSPGEGIGYPFQYSWASLVAQLVKNPPAMCETWV